MWRILAGIDSNEAPPAAAAAPAAPDAVPAVQLLVAPPPGGPGRGRVRDGAIRGRGRGRGRGFHHSDGVRSSISHGRCQQFAKKLQQDSASFFQTFQHRVAHNTFGNISVDLQETLQRTIELDENFAVKVDCRHGHTSDVSRGVFSFLAAHVEGLRSFLEFCATDANSRGLIASSSFDDANMWIRLPKNDAVRDGDRKDKQKGRNIHMNVMNRTENLFMSQGRAGCPRVIGVPVMSPGIVLPASNWATLWSRWKRWSAATCTRPGDGLDPSGKLDPHIQAVPRKTLLFCKDAASTGANIEVAVFIIF